MLCPECKEYDIKEKLEKQVTDTEIIFTCNVCGYEKVIPLDEIDED